MNSKLMHSKLVSRFALTALLGLSACFSLHAQADVAAVTTMTFSIPDEVTIHKTLPYLKVGMTLADPAGLTSCSLSGGYASGGGNFPAGTTKGSSCLYFFSSYFPTGNYPFKASVTNAKGIVTTHNLMVHLVP